MTDGWKHVPLGKGGWPEVPYGAVEVEYAPVTGLPWRYRA